MDLAKFKAEGGKQLLKEAQVYMKSVMRDLDVGCTHYHSAANNSAKLKAAGFIELKEIDQWDLEAGKGYYFTRNASTLIAFRLPPKQEKSGANLFKIVCTHNDSPCLRLAPISKMENRVGF